MPDIPYRPKVQLGSIRQTTKKMMATKTGGAKVGDTQLKKFLKQDKGLRRVAYGDKTQTMESWKGRHYIKEVKEKVATSEQYKETVYGKHHTAAEAFRDTVKEEVRQEQSAQHTPNKDELSREKRIEQAKQHLHQYERAREIEKATGRPYTGGGGSETGGPQGAKGGSAKPSKAVPLAGGGIPTGAATPHRSGGASGSASIGTSSAAPGPLSSLPPLFGFRARTLRIDIDARTLFVHILNAPTALSIFIGRDLTLKVPTDAPCSAAGAPIVLENLKVNDLIDAKGKTLNDVFVVDELYKDNPTLPSFVVDLDANDAEGAVPPPPDDLAIG